MVALSHSRPSTTRRFCSTKLTDAIITNIYNLNKLIMIARNVFKLKLIILTYSCWRVQYKYVRIIWYYEFLSSDAFMSFGAYDSVIGSKCNDRLSLHAAYGMKCIKRPIYDKIGKLMQTVQLKFIWLNSKSICF